MKFWAPFALQDSADLKTLVRFVTQSVTNISQLATGNVNFQDNIQCTITDTALSSVETPVPHSLGIVPIGFLVLNVDSPGIIYAGTSPWNNKYIYLRSSVSVTAKIAVIGG